MRIRLMCNAKLGAVPKLDLQVDGGDCKDFNVTDFNVLHYLTSLTENGPLFS